MQKFRKKDRKKGYDRMNSFVVHELLNPLIRRAGTAVSAYLLGTGAAQSDAESVGLGVAAFAAILLELGLSKKSRK